MILETRAQFARRLGVARSLITKWVADGRIVLFDDMIDVEASQQRIKDTVGNRPDVAARHAVNRAAGKQIAAQAPTPAATENEIGRGGTRVDHQTRKEAALADKAEMEVQQMRGNLIPREDVDATLMALGATMRARVEAMPNQLTPIVAPPTDFDEVHALNSEAARALLAGMADDLDRARKALERAGSRS